MGVEELAQVSIGSCRGAREIVHDLKNRMSIVLLRIGNLAADPGCMGHDQRTLEALENMIFRLNCQVEELAILLEKDAMKRRRAPEECSVTIRTSNPG